MHIFRRSNLVVAILVAVCLGGGVAVASSQLGGPWEVGILAGGIAIWIGLRRFINRWLQVRHPLPNSSLDWLERHVAFYRGLDSRDRRQFERAVQIALADMSFEGVAGVAVTRTLRLAVAAGIALMWFGRPGWDIPYKHTVLFYPGSFNEEFDLEDRPIFDGMMRENGPLLLSAPAVTHGWQRADGLNVVLHELAHVLDFQGSGPPGLPALLDPSSATAWKTLVDHEMEKVRNGQSILRNYAATNRAELFAVAVEQFFERPRQLKDRHKELFDALVVMFNFDPTPQR
ncbi:MAG: M90 family metallopeptidase [Rubricoccaceae bacterium]|nr:M90 family metallopeptidase [Rubricoccaceae bacterium]